MTRAQSRSGQLMVLGSRPCSGSRPIMVALNAGMDGGALNGWGWGVRRGLVKRRLSRLSHSDAARPRCSWQEPRYCLSEIHRIRERERAAGSAFIHSAGDSSDGVNTDGEREKAAAATDSVCLVGKKTNMVGHGL